MKLQTEREIDLLVATEELHDDGEYQIKKITSKKILFPDKLVLNGDIFELWDASDQSIHFASYSILRSISRLACEKLYLIGNHDFANAELAEEEDGKVGTFSNLYPWGLSDLNIIRDTYPTPREGMVRTLRVGENDYLLLHGHQFTKSFRIAPWKIFSLLRDGAEAFRLYSWVLVGSWLIWLVGFPFMTYLEPSITRILYGIGFLLTILAYPRIFASIARPIWNSALGRSDGNMTKDTSEIDPVVRGGDKSALYYPIKNGKMVWTAGAYSGLYIRLTGTIKTFIKNLSVKEV